MVAVYPAGPIQQALEVLIHGSQRPVLLHDGLLVAIIRQLLRIAAEGQQSAPEYTEHLVNAFNSHLQWIAGNKHSILEHRSTQSDPAISNALKLIEDHLNDTITIKSLCTSVHVTPALFRRRFQDVTGMPVHRYIVRRRVERARELIDETNLALSVVAIHSGFSSQSHMTTVFKRELGMTPSEQRRTKSKSQDRS